MATKMPNNNWFAVHPTLHGGVMFPLTWLNLEAIAGKRTVGPIEDFELWWLLQLLKHKQPVTFYRINFPDPLTAVMPMTPLAKPDKCEMKFDPPRWEGGKDKPIEFHTATYMPTLKEPRYMFWGSV